jgi:hypothetical protein
MAGMDVMLCPLPGEGDDQISYLLQTAFACRERENLEMFEEGS